MKTLRLPAFALLLSLLAAPAALLAQPAPPAATPNGEDMMELNEALKKAALAADPSLRGFFQNNPVFQPLASPRGGGPGGPPAAVPAVSGPPPLTSIVPDGKVHKFEARDHQFWVDGQPTMLLTGEMHFGRVLPEDFETRILQAKALGLNGLSFYLFWNLVEVREGVFEFTGRNDVRKMIELCQKHGMWVVLRPGPYCCAEVDYGGIPWWTVKYPDVTIRSNDPTWVEWSRRYFAALYKEVGDLQVTKGGPIVMFQLDNEYGLIGPPNVDYLVSLKNICKDVGFDVQLFTCDPAGAPEWTSPAFRIPGVMSARNGLRNANEYAGIVGALEGYPVFVPEAYTSWFSGWGEAIATRNSSNQQITSNVDFFFNNHFSFCLYMFFGGTNYGFMTGANEYLPLQTSYNYSAPIDEAGRTTPKYHALRELIARRTNRTLPEPPPEPTVIEIPAFKLTQGPPLLSTLPRQPTRSATQPLSMEELDQDFGFVLYRKQLPGGAHGPLVLDNVMDYAIIMVNGKRVGDTFRGLGAQSYTTQLNTDGPVTLDILVYNLGRISVITAPRSQARARKGLLGGATLAGQPITGWDMYSLPVASVANVPEATGPNDGPTYYRGTFNVDQVGGTFLDMRNWKFGVVWVNGHNLGRFWDRGALRTLYVPGHWLKPGANDIAVLELHAPPTNPEISGGTEILTTPPVPWALNLTQNIPLVPAAPAAQ